MIKRKKKETTIDNLAGMVQRGFSELGGEIKEVKEEVKEIKGQLKNVISSQEDIKLRMDDVAHHFEIVELQKRVEVLERKMARS